jgi:hypothetical protein
MTPHRSGRYSSGIRISSNQTHDVDRQIEGLSGYIRHPDPGEQFGHQSNSGELKTLIRMKKQHHEQAPHFF